MFMVDTDVQKPLRVAMASKKMGHEVGRRSHLRMLHLTSPLSFLRSSIPSNEGSCGPDPGLVWFCLASALGLEGKLNYEASRTLAQPGWEAGAN